MIKDKWIIEGIKGSSLRTKLSALKKFILEKSKIDDLTKCALCPNMCRFNCPVNIVHARETTSPAGKTRIALFIREKYITLNNDNVKPLYYCMNCDLCSVYCPYSFSVNDLIKLIRKEAISNAIYPKSLHSLLNNLKKFKCIYGEFKSEISFNTNIYEDDFDILYFPGCIAIKYYPHHVANATIIFEKIGFRARVFDIPFDCGYLAFELGLDTLFYEIAQSLASELNKYKVNYIVSPCPECVFMLREIYPQYKIKIKAKILHTLELINDYIDKLNLKINEEATFHDSSALIIKLSKPDLFPQVLSKLGIKINYPIRYGRNMFETANENTILFWIDEHLANEINNERYKELIKFSNKIIVPSYAAKKSFERLGVETLEIMELLSSKINKSE